MSHELWRTTLETLRDRFASGAQKHPGLCCALIHAGPGERSRIYERLQLCRGSSDFVDGGFAAYEETDTPDKCSWRHYYYVGDKAGVALFLNLARDAGRCLCSIPDDIVEPIPSLSRRAKTPAQAWVWSVFELAWQKRPGSPLKASKLIWDAEHTGVTTYPYDTEELRGLSRTLGGGPAFLQAWIERLPDYFCSELPDVFMASVYAIDILLSDASRDAALRGVVATDDGEARETRSDPLQQLRNAHNGADGVAARKRPLGAMPHDDHAKLWWVAELLKTICEEVVDEGNGLSSFPYMDRQSVDHLLGKLYVALDWNNSVISDPDSREIRNGALRDVLKETHKPLGQILRALRDGLKTSIPILSSFVDKARRARLVLLASWRAGREARVEAGLANCKETTQSLASAEPLPPAKGVAPVLLGGPDDPVTVLGTEKDPLSPAEYRALKALVDAGSEGLNKDSLELEGGGGARRTLTSLKNRDADWDRVIRFPGKPGRGYRIVDPRNSPP